MKYGNSTPKRIVILTLALFFPLGLFSCIDFDDPIHENAAANSDLRILYEAGRIIELTTFRADVFQEDKLATTRYLAIWYKKSGGQFKDESYLKIFEKINDTYVERYQVADKSFAEIRALAPLNSSVVPGVVVTFEHSDFWFGRTIVFGLVEGRFRKVYEGATSELVDLDGDGIPEILESSWPNGDGFPSVTRTHRWNGQLFEKTHELPWDNRFRVEPHMTK
jgi:hypothetical protein